MSTKKLIIPSEIPWSEIKGANLEELLYWLFDSMGAKNLVWRIGGSGSGTADQGRDIELSFFTPSPDGNLNKENWWVETKGRSATVEPRAVYESVLNASGRSHIAVLVIATNTNFSNPTRDWVNEWQKKHPHPLVKLWERTELENLCSKNPLAVIRLHSKALSIQGKVEVTSTKLWNYATFTDEPTLKTIWEKRDGIDLNERSLLALVSSEIACGDIRLRSWALLVSDEILVTTLCNGLINFLYLVFRINERGVRQEPLIKGLSYLILIAIHRLGKQTVLNLISNIWNNVEGKEYPDDVRKTILEPILGNLLWELRDICISDCQRISTDRVTLKEEDMEGYWKRLTITNATDDNKDCGILIIESRKESCKVGFCLEQEKECPLCHIDDPYSKISQLIDVVDMVTRYRTNEKDDV